MPGRWGGQGGAVSRTIWVFGDQLNRRIGALADADPSSDRVLLVESRRLLDAGGPSGRKLDFLSQELNRESNTLCAKSNDVELTNIGLELKTVVEQFREQVQNLE